MPTITGMIWGTNLRKSVTVTAGAIAAVCGAIVAVPPAWSELGLPEVASKFYVEYKVHPIELAQADATRALYQLQLQNLESSLYSAKVDQQKAPSQTVDQRIQELNNQIQNVQQKLNTQNK